MQPITPNMDLPAVEHWQVRAWLKTLLSDRDTLGRQFLNTQQANAYRFPESFDQTVFDGIKLNLALCRACEAILTGVLGEDSGPSQEDMDETFFSQMSAVYGYDVTKPRNIGEPVSRKVAV